jgi:hypothetical protein
MLDDRPGSDVASSDAVERCNRNGPLAVLCGMIGSVLVSIEFPATKSAPTMRARAAWRILRACQSPTEWSANEDGPLMKTARR